MAGPTNQRDVQVIVFPGCFQGDFKRTAVADNMRSVGRIMININPSFFLQQLVIDYNIEFSRHIFDLLLPGKDGRPGGTERPFYLSYFLAYLFLQGQAVRKFFTFKTLFVHFNSKF